MTAPNQISIDQLPQFIADQIDGTLSKRLEEILAKNPQRFLLPHAAPGAHPDMTKAEADKQARLTAWWRGMLLPRQRERMGAEKWEALEKSFEFKTTADLNTATDGEGGYLVPVEFSSELIVALENISELRTVARVIRTAAQKQKIPTVSAKPTFGWVDEDAEIGQTDATFGQIELDAWKCGGWVAATRELLADGLINVNALLIELFGEQFALVEQAAFAVGDGTKKPKGLHSLSISTVTAPSGALGYTDVNRLYYGLPQQYRRRAAWVGNNAAIQAAAAIIATTGQPMFSEPTSDMPPKLKGKSIVELPDLPGAGTSGDKTTLYFGAMNLGYYIKDTEDVRVESTTQSDTAFKKDLVMIKAIKRVDGDGALLASMRKMTGVYS